MKLLVISWKRYMFMKVYAIEKDNNGKFCTLEDTTIALYDILFVVFITG